MPPCQTQGFPIFASTRSPWTSPTGTPVPASLTSVDPHYEVCASLVQDSEALGSVTFGLELASSGAPLRVLPPAGEGTPTPLVRCLMERACQLQATASPPGQKMQLNVPLQLHRGQPVVAQPLPTDARLDVVSVTPRPERSELQLQLRAVAANAMLVCGAVPDRARVRLSLDLVESMPIHSPRRPRRLVIASPPPTLRVKSQRTETLEGACPSRSSAVSSMRSPSVRFPRLAQAYL